MLSQRTGTFSPTDNRHPVAVMPVIERSPLLRNALNRQPESDSTPYDPSSFSPLDKEKQDNSYVSSPWSSTNKVEGGIAGPDAADVDDELFQAVLYSIVERINLIKMDEDTDDASAFH